MKKLLKYIFSIILLAVIIGFVYLNEGKIYNLYKDIMYKDDDFIVKNKNPYYRNYDFNFVKNVDKLVATKKEDIVNIYYTGLNTGANSFEFKCSTKYEKCLDDVEKIADNNTILSEINNFVHPYNSFKNINTTYTDIGIVTVEIKHMYTKEDIEAINNKINAIYPALANGYDKNNVDSIKSTITTIHDYIINTTKYDSDRADRQIINYKSDIAYGPLFEGYAICGGYTDLVELLLEKMEIKSYRISSKKHVWNAINISGTWYNLDLTWDDPVTNTGEQLLLNDYLLIDTNTMLSKDTSQHTFNTDVYSELKST